MKNFLPLIMLILLASCTTGINDDETTFTGKYRVDYETGTFYPDGIKEKWLVQTGLSKSNFKSSDRQSICYRDVVFEGRVSRKEDFDSHDNYSRALAITRIIKQTPISCRGFSAITSKR